MATDTNNHDTKDKIIKLIKSGAGVVTTSEIASQLKISWNTAEKYLLELVIAGEVQKIKKAGVNLWVMIKK